MCQHCEQAPCEPVCPVNATTHSPEGINEMTYNRCIGSRFCMVNCPYQVRSFNYKDYHSNEKEPLECLHNPDVTIRMRGIAEKCTLCIQRIIQGKYKARDEGKLSLVDGEIKTACQVVCPTGAIVFGDLNNPISRVKKMKQLQNSYTLLEELNTKPSVFYLSKIMNEF
jgi:molybdopterin-containing oxidoreductase family iron-sulfur binding subunit